jgi:NAD(P)-dependent dehydrogenase (short-subunit alcohol dehydrogenase family)
MEVKGSVALVSGANRGIGKELVTALLGRGAAKVYAAARNPASVERVDERVVAVPLDLLSDASISALSARCPDVTILINNAAVYESARLLGAPTLAGARHEMDVNYFGTLSLTRAFAPVLKKNGGGAVVILQSVLGLVNVPVAGSYSASKAAVWNMTQGLRAELARQKTRVIAVMPGVVDAGMSAEIPVPRKVPVGVVTKDAMDAIEGDLDDIFSGDEAQYVWAQLRTDPKGLERQFAKSVPLDEGH